MAHWWVFLKKIQAYRFLEVFVCNFLKKCKNIFLKKVHAYRYVGSLFATEDCKRTLSSAKEHRVLLQKIALFCKKTPQG